MRIYDLYQGQTLKGYIRVEDDGQKTWDLSDDEFRGWWLDTDDRKAIEQGIDHAPQQEFLIFKGYTIRQRPNA